MPFRIKIFVSILLALFVLLLVGPFLIPVPPLEETVAPAELASPGGSAGGDAAAADATDVEIEGDGLTTGNFTGGDFTGGENSLYYRETGNGSPAFLLLHGYPSNAASWRDVQPELSLYGRTVAYDRPGFGLSARPERGSWRRGENPYRPEAQVEQALALLDDLGIASGVWVGSSAGAELALRAALRDPRRVDALVLIGTPVYDDASPPPWLRPLLHSPQLNRLGPLLMRQLGAEPGMRLYASQWADPDRIDQEDVSAFRRTFDVHDWDRGLWEVSKASRDTGLEQRLGEVRVPVLVISGAEDPIVDPEDAERLAREIPGATLALMPGCGHLPHEECPAQFMEVVGDWLASLPRADEGRPGKTSSSPSSI